jgi:hypothetical protein
MMMRAVKLEALTILALLEILPANLIAVRAELPVNIATLEAPNDSCGTWGAERGAPDPTLWQTEWFALGFLSGMAVMQAGTDFLKGLKEEAVYGWLDNYCRAHPLDSLPTALINLSAERGMKPGSNYGR